MQRTGNVTALLSGAVGPPTSRPEGKQYGLAILFRAITLFAGVLGWMELVQQASAAVVMFAVLVIGAVLAAVVAIRWHGTRRQKLGVAGGFVGFTIAAALYSVALSLGLQESTQPLGIIGWGVVLLPISPVAVLMLRAWTWSAHDRTIFRAD